MTPTRLVTLIVVVGLIWSLWPEGEVRHGPGVVAAQVPRQTAVDGAVPFDHLGYAVTPLARFEIEARVLGREGYRYDRGAELAPLDLALGWGRMSDEAVLDEITISQGGRWYRWKTRNFPIPRREIEQNSANMHLIPKDEWVEETLEEVRSGQVVALTGYLVEVRGDDGWRWRSSLTRNDTGARACELVYVERAAIVAP